MDLLHDGEHLALGYGILGFDGNHGVGAVADPDDGGQRANRMQNLVQGVLFAPGAGMAGDGDLIPLNVRGHPAATGADGTNDLFVHAQSSLMTSTVTVSPLVDT